MESEPNGFPAGSTRFDVIHGKRDRATSRREEPALYKTFVFSNGSLAHRCGTLVLALGVQLGLMVLIG